MAGRAKSLLTSPNRPSPKDDSLILYFEVDVKRLIELGKDYPWSKPHGCPCCCGQRLWGHGYVYRYFEGLTQGLWMKRYRCPDCKGVHTCRPQEFYKGFHHSVLTIFLSLLQRIIHGRWLRCLSRQVQQYWWKGLRRQASRFHNVRFPDGSIFARLLRNGICPATHSFQYEILRL